MAHRPNDQQHPALKAHTDFIGQHDVADATRRAEQEPVTFERIIQTIRIDILDHAPDGNERDGIALMTRDTVLPA